jgi:hypothetical protein
MTSHARPYRSPSGGAPSFHQAIPVEHVSTDRLVAVRDPSPGDGDHNTLGPGTSGSTPAAASNTPA